MIVWMFLFLIAIFLLNKIRRFRRLHKTLYKLPGPPISNFLFGNSEALYTTPDGLFKVIRNWSKTYYPIFKITVLNMSSANIVDPHDCELIMNNMSHNNKSFAYRLLRSWLGTGLLTSSGDKWQTRRKILTPAFHFSILQEFVTIFNEETEEFVKNLKKECHKPYIAINDKITEYTLKSIAETAMGTKLNFDTEKGKLYKKSVFEIGEIALYRLFRIWLGFRVVYIFTSLYYREKKLLKTLHSFTNKVILEREQKFKLDSMPNSDNINYFKKKRRLAMLDLLLDAKNRGEINHDGIREEVDTFMFEGHDTTGAALGFALMTLACDKNVQDQILEEMYEVLNGDIHKKPSLNELQNMRYLDRCLKEVLRMYPSVTFIARELGADLVTNSGYLLPAGTMCNIHIYDIHHNPEFYPEPEKFDPDRFLPENIKNRHLFAYIPFSAGARNCIGQRFALLELKSAVCGVLANFILEPVDTHKTIELVCDLVLRTKDPIRVKFIPRK